MNKKRIFGLTVIMVFSACFLYSCSVVNQFANTLANLKRLQFRLSSVSDFNLSGIQIGRINTVKDINLMDAARLTANITQKKLPIDFVLNVAAINPNDGKNKTQATNAIIKGMDWRLFIDDVQTITGGLDREFSVPATGQETIIPIRIQMDLISFFKNKTYDGLVNLALAIGGANSSPAKLKLDMKPTIMTASGITIPYPGRITVIDKEFH